MPRRLQAKIFAILIFLLAGPAAAGSPVGAGESILVVSGGTPEIQIGVDRAMLAALPQNSLRTSTVWTEGVKMFEGVLVRDLLDRLGLGAAETARLSALNNYSIDVPVSDFYRYDVILAQRMDGSDLTRRDKGPLWVVYPRDEVEELRDERYDIRWVWQLNRIELF